MLCLLDRLAQFFSAFRWPRGRDKARREMLPAPQYSQNSGWGLLPLPCWWYFGHVLAFRDLGGGSSGEEHRSLLLYSSSSRCMATCCTLAAPVLLIAKTIGSRWLCPILPWNSFKLKKLEYCTCSWFIARKWDSLYSDFINCEFHRYWWESRLFHCLLSTAQHHGHAKVRKVQLYFSVISKADSLHLWQLLG